MRKIREVLRLRWGAGLSLRDVARSAGVGKSTALECLQRAAAAGLAWPLPEGLDDGALERRLYPPSEASRVRRVEPAWEEIHRELRGKGVTLFLLWQEYRERHSEGYGYSQFCERYARWRARVDVVMRQAHRAGEKLFVDYAGQTVAVVDAETGEERRAQIFVAVLGASNYTYAEATWTQGLPDWIGAHVRALAYLGGVPQIIVPDNLKSAVVKAHRYEPDLNPTYRDFAAHYGLAVVPARVRKPRDKAKVEAGVLLVERWILARLRHRRFFGLEALNAAIAELLEALNARPFKKLPGSRRSHFERLDRPALGALPSAPYEYAEWHKARVAPDSHLEVEGHRYSVPYGLVRVELDVRTTAQAVEVFHKGRRVAAHARSLRPGGCTTVAAHLPEAHRRYLEWTPERLAAWARGVGPSAVAFVARLIAERPHPYQGIAVALGVMRLEREYGAVRLEAACARALAIGTLSGKSVASILATGLDARALPEPAAPGEPIVHANLRGAGYYH